jgi:hypothetical protein
MHFMPREAGPYLPPMNEIWTLLPDQGASYTRGKPRISVQVEEASTLGCGVRSAGEAYKRSTGLWTPRPPRLGT